MKKKAVLAVTVLMVILAVFGISRLFPSYSSVIKSNWGISLPIMAELTET